MKHHGTGCLKTMLLLGSILILIPLLTAGFRQPHRCTETAEIASLSPAAEEAALFAPETPNAALLGFRMAESPVHILLAGQDRREGETRARADAIILCSFLPEENRLVLTSFLRDLYVPIPGYQPDRINAAYAYGGMPLLRQTLEENFDLSIRSCVEVDFSRFSQVVDSLGGVTIALRQDEADAINEAVCGTLTEGAQLLNGAQALAYTRIRNLDRDGDFSRTSRQRTVLTALLKQFQNAGLMDLLAAVREILPMLSTDMSQQQMATLAVQLFPMLSDAHITSQRIPADGTFSYSTIRNMAVLEADLEAARQFLAESFQPEECSALDAQPPYGQNS